MPVVTFSSLCHILCMIRQPEALRVILKQPRNWKVTVIRASMDKLLYQMVYPYLSVYLAMLGASGAGLGLANGIGMGVSAFYGPVSVNFMHREGTKRVYLGGIAIVALSYFLLGISWTWVLGVLGIIVWWVGSTEVGLSCSVVCGSSLANENRATAMGSCETVALGIMSFIGPAAGAFIISMQGGLTTGTLRPLFFIVFAGELGVFWFIRRCLGECGYIAAHDRTLEKGGKTSAAAGSGTRKLARSFGLLRRDKKLWRYVTVTCLTYLPTGMVLPFIPLFAKEAKGASPFILGAMVTASSLVSLAAGLPLGHLADRIGRKKILYALAPIFALSNVVLVLSPHPAILLVAGLLMGVFPITQVVSGAMSFEQVAAEDIGDWVAVLRFFKMGMGAILAVLSGFIWDILGGQWIFIIAAGIELLVRLPLLVSIPETLTGGKTA
jgi:MFS family permease